MLIDKVQHLRRIWLWDDFDTFLNHFTDLGWATQGIKISSPQKISNSVHYVCILKCCISATGNFSNCIVFQNHKGIQIRHCINDISCRMMWQKKSKGGEARLLRDQVAKKWRAWSNFVNKLQKKTPTLRKVCVVKIISVFLIVPNEVCICLHVLCCYDACLHVNYYVINHNKLLPI